MLQSNWLEDRSLARLFAKPRAEDRPAGGSPRVFDPGLLSLTRNACCDPFRVVVAWGRFLSKSCDPSGVMLQATELDPAFDPGGVTAISNSSTTRVFDPERVAAGVARAGARPAALPLLSLTRSLDVTVFMRST